MCVCPTCCYVKTEDPDLPAYYFDPVINPISAHASSGTAQAGPPPAVDDDDQEGEPSVKPMVDPIKLEKTGNEKAPCAARAPSPCLCAAVRRAGAPRWGGDWQPPSSSAGT